MCIGKHSLVLCKIGRLQSFCPGPYIFTVSSNGLSEGGGVSAVFGGMGGRYTDNSQK